MVISNKQPITHLEDILEVAQNKQLIDDYVRSPFTNQPYIMVRFLGSTPNKTKLALKEHVIVTYQIDSAELVSDDTTLYIMYDFWKRHSPTT